MAHRVGATLPGPKSMCGIALLVVAVAGAILMALSWERMAARRRRARDATDRRLSIGATSVRLPESERN